MSERSEEERLSEGTQPSRAGLFPTRRCVIWITINCDSEEYRRGSGGCRGGLPAPQMEWSAKENPAFS